MANLIITVISIALVAVAALMGAYYGGTAFMDGQTKAYVNTALSDIEQAAGAANMYFLNERDGVATFPTGNQSNVATLYLVPKYLINNISRSQYTVPSVSIDGALFYTFLKSTGALLGPPSTDAVTTTGFMLAGSYPGPASQSVVDLCKKFVETLGDKAAFAPRIGPSFTSTLPSAELAAGKRYFCQYADENGNGLIDTADTRFYLLYMFR